MCSARNKTRNKAPVCSVFRPLSLSRREGEPERGGTKRWPGVAEICVTVSSILLVTEYWLCNQTILLPLTAATLLTGPP